MDDNDFPQPAAEKHRFSFLPHLRGVVLTLLALVVLPLVLLRALDLAGGPQPGASLAALQAANDAGEFDALVSMHWQRPDASPPPAGKAAPEPRQGAAMTRLRWMLFIDSSLLVPGYAGLLLLYTVLFWKCLTRGGFIDPRLEGRARQPAFSPLDRLPMHLLCLAAVLAALFDVAENGMTMRAAEDSLAGLLADPTVVDLHRATQLKWTCLALAAGVAGVLAGGLQVHRWRATRRHYWQLEAGVACAVLAFALLPEAYPWSRPELTEIGVVAFGLELLFFAWAAWNIAGGIGAEDATDLASVIERLRAWLRQRRPAPGAAGIGSMRSGYGRRLSSMDPP